MPALSIIAIAPSAPREAFREPALAIAAARAGATGVLDFEYVAQEAWLEAYGKLAKHAKLAEGGQIGIRCRSGQAGLSLLANQEIKASGNGEAPLLILTASAGRFDQAILSKDIATAKLAGFVAVVEAIDLNEAKLAEQCGAQAVIAKGHEGAGRIGDGTTFVLVQQFVREIALPIWAQGGIGLHSAAAVVAAGASGVVLDSQLYLCRDSLLSAQSRQRLEKFDGSETTVLHGPDGLFRIYAENGSARLAQLQTALLSQNSYALVAALQANVASAADDNDPLWPIGQDSCFAAHFAKVGGTVAGAIDAIKQQIDLQVEIAAKASALAENSDLAKSHGTLYPIVQGAMTRVSDSSDFAYDVAKAGGLPFLALSLMRAAEIETLLQETQDKLGIMPWGVGLLGFVPPALRQEQMAVVDKFKPPFALIAGGRPDQAKAMEDAGTKTYLHVPSPLLLKSFIEMGSRRFIFEGKECGGHVGPRSSFVLWQSMIEVMLDAIGPRENASAFHVLFAGGIHDDVSAAMVATLTAPLSARGIKVGFLVGTAYLFTEEAVSSGAIVNKFQQAALKCDQTVLLETGPGHSIRCIESPYKEIFDNRRIELQGQNKSRDEIREELELMNLGRLRIASKGLSRGNSNQLATIPDEQQWQEGMYMIGQVAALHDKVMTIAELHHNISANGNELLVSSAQQQKQRQMLDAAELSNRNHKQEDIAIVGMSCQFPQSNDVETYWTNILNKVDSITEIPKSHFDWQNYFDANPLARDKIISKWGGFLSDVVFDPAPYGIPPSSLDSIDPMQVLILEAARSALLDAGYNERKFPRDKTSVILANAGHGPITALYSLRSMLGWKLDGLDEATTDQIKAVLPEWTEDSFAGYLGNVAAGRVANRFDLKGINFSIDAACASSLAALYVGISDLRSRASDVVLLGATDTHNQPGDYLSFSKTHALSANGRCKTFDAKADGIAISEGIAILVLKRLSDAERDGDRIYAVIKGIAGSSDGRDLSLTAPRPAGQMLALHRAYEDAGISPSTVQIVEAHGTGTVAGDKAEVEALTNVFRNSGAELGSCAIGSVKTNIGHSKAAAGLASIIKIAKALHHKVLPPTINVSDPSPACKFNEGPFYVNTESRPWLNTAHETPRRGGVSAFGFGGTNFHAVLEEYVAPCKAEVAPVVEAWPAELFVWKAATSEDMLKAVAQTEAAVKKMRLDFAIESKDTSQARRRLFELASNLYQKTNLKRSGKAANLNEIEAASSASLAIVASSIDDLEQKIAQVKTKLANKEEQFSLPTGVHFKASSASSSTSVNKVAFLFPGQGSQKVNMLKELAIYFPEILDTVEQADRYISENADQPGFEKFSRKNDSKNNSLSQYIFPAATLSETKKLEQQERLTSTDVAQPALGVCDLAMLRLLGGFGLKADMVAGHSYGEYVALHAGGVFSAEDLIKLSIARGLILGQCAAQNPGAMAAVSASPEVVTAALKQMPGVYLANINTPTQSIISGSSEAIEAAITLFKAKQITAKAIAVSAAFHSPLMSGADKQLAEVLAAVTCQNPKIAVYSNSTSQPYVSDSATIVKQLSEHALKPVLFVDQLQAMHDAGARLFVEVGPGAVLTGLTEASLNGRDFVAVNCERSGKNGLEHFLSMLGRLAVNGAEIDLGKLYWNRLFSHKSKIRSHFAASGKQLLYTVNSVSIGRIKDGQPTLNAYAKPMSAVAPVAKAATQAASQATTAASSANLRPQVSSTPVSGSANKAPQPTAAKPLLDTNRQIQTDGKARQTNGQLAMDTNNRKNGTQPVGRPDQNVDKVMLEFQQSMLEMTNRFLETQQNVMLAYLQANGRGAGVQPQLMQPAMPVLPQTQNQIATLPYVEQTAQAYDASSYGNGSNGNGSSNNQNGNGNGAYGNGSNGSVASNGNGYNATQSNAPELAAVAATAAGTGTGAAGVEQATTAAVAESNLVDPEALAESLFEIVSERTGYPRSMLDPTLDLEADLGIDSIKRVEILNNFRKLLPESTQAKLESGIEKLAGTKTLQGIVDWINTLNDLDEVETASSQATEASATVATKKVGNVEKIARGVVVSSELPPAKATTKALAPVTLIIADQQEPAKQIAALLDGLDKSLGAKNNILINRKSLIDEQTVKQVINQIRDNFGPIGAVINICNVTAQPSQNSTAQLSQLSSTFLLAKAVEADLKGHAAAGRHSSFVNVTYLGGNFNGSANGQTLNLPQLAYQGGVVGLTKTIAQEMPGVHTKVVDLNLDTTAEDAAKAILSELFADDNIVEVGFILGKRLGLVVKEAPYESVPALAKPSLNSSSVVLVTGGARGITAKITQELAKKYKPTFVIVGRLPRPKDTEAASTAGLNSAKEIKAALIDERKALGQTINVREIEQTYQLLLREREVRSSLEALKEVGATAKYYSVDISDAVAFGELIDSIYETSNIDGVIHGAGIIEDALIKDKSLESFERVYNTKIKGAITLSEKVRLDTLQFMYFFSSVVGRTGNPGQADYVSANEALNKLALNIKTRTSARVASLMWGPWQAGMAPPELEEVFASHGWSMIQPEDGSVCFLEEVSKDCSDQVEVMLVGKLLSKTTEPTPTKTAASSTAAVAPIVRAQLAAKNMPTTLLPPAKALVPTGVLLNNAEVADNNSSFLVKIDTKKHVYLQDHKFDGIPVLPMAVALELMIEAARAVYPDRHLVQVADLDIPSGIVFHTSEKDFVVEVGIDADDESTVAVQLLSANPRKAHFRCKAKFAQQGAICPEVWNTELAAPIQSKFNLRDLPASTSELPQPKDLYGTWLFHGPAFQGLASIICLANNDIAGEITGSAPRDFVTTADSSQWIVDPLLVDSAMQLAGVWARHHQDVTVLPNGFRNMYLFRPISLGTVKARVFLGTSSATDLLCDLAIYNENGELALVVEGLGGIASKTFNRFASSPPVQELAR